MTTAKTTTNEQPGELARFLDEHPEFTPVYSDNAVLCGFRVGANCLSLDNVQGIFYYPSSPITQASSDRAAQGTPGACVTDGFGSSEARLAEAGEK